MNVNQNMHIRPLSEPRELQADYLLKGTMFPILTCGIVNPHGPTFTSIAVIDDDTSAPPAVVYTYLNPFKSELSVLGYVFSGDLSNSFVDQILGVLAPMKIFAMGAPSFCIRSPYLDPLMQSYLQEQLFQESPGIKGLLQGMDKFPLDPWSRVTEEVQTAQNLLIGKESNQSEEGTAAGDELSTFVQKIQDQEHCQLELTAFLHAWSGAIKFQQDLGNLQKFPELLSFDRAAELIARILSSSEFALRAE